MFRKEVNSELEYDKDSVKYSKKFNKSDSEGMMLSH